MSRPKRHTVVGPFGQARSTAQLRKPARPLPKPPPRPVVVAKPAAPPVVESPPGQGRKARRRRAQAAEVARLMQAYPLAFPGGKPRPLAIGISTDLLREADPASTSRLAVLDALRCWTGRHGYLKAVAAPGSRRVRLDGSDAGEVSATDRAFAVEALRAKSGPAQPSNSPADGRGLHS